MKNSLKRLCTLGVIGGVLLGFAVTGTATADEPVNSDTTTVVEEVATPPVEEVAPVEEVVPVEEVPVVTPEEVPAPETPAVVQESVQPVTQATVVPETKTLKWILPNGGTSSNVTWPQPVASDANLALIPCGTTVTIQVDTYPYTTAEDKARTDALAADGILAQGEDYGWAQSWYFEKYSAPQCPPNALYLSSTQQCGSADITLRNVSPWIYPTSVKVDGVHSYGPTVDNRTDGKLNGPQKDQSKTRTISFPEDSGTHTIEYRIDAGSEKNLYVGTSLNEWVTLTIETDCQPNVVIPNPQVDLTATCGSATAVLTNVGDGRNINQTASFIIEVDGKFYGAYAVVADGSETVTITFDEDSGDRVVDVYQAGINDYKLIGTVTADTDCIPPVVNPPTEEPPVVNPPQVNSPVVTPLVTVTETPVAGTLATTGMDASSFTGYGILGAILLAVGATIVVARRLKASE